MDGRMFDGLDTLFIGMFVLCCVFVPLGLWKLIELCIWLYNHVHIGVS